MTPSQDKIIQLSSYTEQLTKILQYKELPTCTIHYQERPYFSPAEKKADKVANIIRQCQSFYLTTCDPLCWPHSYQSPPMFSYDKNTDVLIIHTSIHHLDAVLYFASVIKRFSHVHWHIYDWINVEQILQQSLTAIADIGQTIKVTVDGLLLVCIDDLDGEKTFSFSNPNHYHFVSDQVRRACNNVTFNFDLESTEDIDNLQKMLSDEYYHDITIKENDSPIIFSTGLVFPDEIIGKRILWLNRSRLRSHHYHKLLTEDTAMAISMSEASKLSWNEISFLFHTVRQENTVIHILQNKADMEEMEVVATIENIDYLNFMDIQQLSMWEHLERLITYNKLDRTFINIDNQFFTNEGNLYTLKTIINKTHINNEVTVEYPENKKATLYKFFEKDQILNKACRFQGI